MRSVLLGFAAGVGVLQTQAALPSIWLTSMTMLVVAVLLVALRNVRAMVRIPVLTVCGAVLGFCWATLFAQAYLRHELPTELEGRDLVVTGTIASLPGFTEQGARFDFRIEQVSTAQFFFWKISLRSFYPRHGILVRVRLPWLDKKCLRSRIIVVCKMGSQSVQYNAVCPHNFSFTLVGQSKHWQTFLKKYIEME